MLTLCCSLFEQHILNYLCFYLVQNSLRSALLSGIQIAVVSSGYEFSDFNIEEGSDGAQRLLATTDDSEIARSAFYFCKLF